MRGADREAQRQIYRQSSIGEKLFIPAKPKDDIFGKDRLFRVCAYCRVSTDNDEQLSSFELQQAHYEQLIGTHPNWDLRRIYADEGISGTSMKKRDDFNAMIAACERGEYDLIVTKSVSRFARNLVDCVSLVRKLKRQNPPVGVFFETDNLNTLSEDSELMLSFLATFAQEESVKKSESMNWSLRQRFKAGKLLTPALLGYERPRDVTGRYIKYAKLEVVESEAEIVRFIFNSFLAGKSTKEIATLLTDIECPTKRAVQNGAKVPSTTYSVMNDIVAVFLLGRHSLRICMSISIKRTGRIVTSICTPGSMRLSFPLKHLRRHRSFWKTGNIMSGADCLPCRS